MNNSFIKQQATDTVKQIFAVSFILLISCSCIARVEPPAYTLDSFDSCYHRVLEIWRQVPEIVDEDKLEAIGTIKKMYTNWPDRCQQELEPGDGYPAKAVLQYWIARYKEKAEWWGKAIPEYEKALEFLHEKKGKYTFPWETESNKTTDSSVPHWIQPIRRGSRKTNKNAAFDDINISINTPARQNSSTPSYNPKWVVFILRGLARSHAHLDQEKTAERYWDLAWKVTPHCPKLLSEYNCWRAEFLYRRAAPKRVEIFETSQYMLTNGVDNPLLKEAETLCKEVIKIYPKPNRRIYHVYGQILYAQGTQKKQCQAIDLWLEGLKHHGIIPKFVEQEWLLKDLQKSYALMSKQQKEIMINVIDSVTKSIPPKKVNIPAIAYMMNLHKLITI